MGTRCWGHLPSRGARGDPPRIKNSPAAGGKGRSAQQLISVPMPFPVFTTRNQVGFLLSTLFSPLFSFPCWRRCGQSLGVPEKFRGLERGVMPPPEPHLIQIRGVSTIKSHIWAAVVEVRAGGSAEGPNKVQSRCRSGHASSFRGAWRHFKGCSAENEGVRMAPPRPKGTDVAASTSAKIQLPRKSWQSRRCPWHRGLVRECGILFG